MKKQWQTVVGVGGIGTGLLFHTNEQQTLGRSESRLVTLSDAKDYCKLHIVFYYIAALLSPNAAVLPIGFVGGDAAGKRLQQEMRAAGMDISHIGTVPGTPTSISICLQYPDRETCNFTADNGACGLLSAQHVKAALAEMQIDENAIVAALPEVSAESRIELLRTGHALGAFCALSIPEAEAAVLGTPEVLTMTNLLAVNEEEARALMKSEKCGKELARELYTCTAAYSPNILLAVTCGARGAWTASRNRLEFVPPFPALHVVNTTGAGDAFLGGMLAGFALGLPFQKGGDDAAFGATPGQSAAELGTICAGLAVETADSIACAVTREEILRRVQNFPLPEMGCRSHAFLLSAYGNATTLISGGCETPQGTPPEHLRAMEKALWGG